MPQTKAERNKKYRDRKKDSGYVKIELYVKPEWRKAIQKLIEQLSSNP